ncbi:MAG: imidazole glycerol phosphate synthase subunit HisH [Spirochaetes bacterium]|jgi:glutamine amidotransferase|nr:imidazole glycerol phosphate synthase subunit HisH [Spirochaetota bacterium]
MITVIDYGMGNIRSVVKAVEKYTADVRVSGDPSSILDSNSLIMPGDGAFGMAMENLIKMGWIEPLKSYIKRGGRFLGICLGFQLLFSTSEEFGMHDGLDIIQGSIVRFTGADRKVPHMGWNNVEISVKSAHMDGIKTNSYFYFIHSYYPQIEDRKWIIGEVDYGVRFPCIVGKGDLIATQFHPEKSHNAGLKIIRNFVESSCR